MLLPFQLFLIFLFLIISDKLILFLLLLFTFLFCCNAIADLKLWHFFLDYLSEQTAPADYCKITGHAVQHCPLSFSLWKRHISAQVDLEAAAAEVKNAVRCFVATSDERLSQKFSAYVRQLVILFTKMALNGGQMLEALALFEALYPVEPPSVSLANHLTLKSLQLQDHVYIWLLRLRLELVSAAGLPWSLASSTDAFLFDSELLCSNTSFFNLNDFFINVLPTLLPSDVTFLQADKIDSIFAASVRFFAAQSVDSVSMQELTADSGALLKLGQLRCVHIFARFWQRLHLSLKSRQEAGLDHMMASPATEQLLLHLVEPKPMPTSRGCVFSYYFSSLPESNIFLSADSSRNSVNRASDRFYRASQLLDPCLWFALSLPNMAPSRSFSSNFLCLCSATLARCLDIEMPVVIPSDSEQAEAFFAQLMPLSALRKCLSVFRRTVDLFTSGNALSSVNQAVLLHFKHAHDRAGVVACFSLLQLLCEGLSAAQLTLEEVLDCEDFLPLAGSVSYQADVDEDGSMDSELMRTVQARRSLLQLRWDMVACMTEPFPAVCWRVSLLSTEIDANNILDQATACINALLFELQCVNNEISLRSQRSASSRRHWKLHLRQSKSAQRRRARIAAQGSHPLDSRAAKLHSEVSFSAFENRDALDICSDYERFARTLLQYVQLYPKQQRTLFIPKVDKNTF